MIVVKVGGSRGIDYSAVCQDVAALIADGQPVVLIHGGSSQTNDIAEALGQPPQFVTSPSGFTSRLTDKKTLEIFQMVYCGKMNKMIVELLQERGVNAVGLSGMDGRIWSGPRKQTIRAVDPDGRKRVIRDNYTGVVKSVNSQLLQTLIQSGYCPVITPPAISDANEAINVDGDRAAAQTAAALSARTLVILSNVPGVLSDFPDEGSLITRLASADLPEAMENHAEGRMRIKLLGAQEALANGVGQVILGDARIAQPIREALSGRGTTIQ